MLVWVCVWVFVHKVGGANMIKRCTAISMNSCWFEDRYVSASEFKNWPYAWSEKKFRSGFWSEYIIFSDAWSNPLHCCWHIFK